MKTIFKTTIILVLICLQSTYSQEKNIETHSVNIDNFIAYIVENYNMSNENICNLTFLIQIPKSGHAIEDKVILKQGFSLLSKRILENNTISILGYSGLNGIAMEQCPASDIKKILYTIENFKSSFKTLHEDGITLAYTHANNHFNDEGFNRVVMVRIPSGNNASEVAEASKQVKQKKNNTLVLTAIALLPEIISVIKD
ncbi:hypothetical protein MHTCC0001_28380 [Flavobacteriaceae bacterium MHTCC 0001]